MTDKSKLTSIDGKGQPCFNKEAFRQFKKEFDMQLEFITMMTELTRAKYKALRKQGFSAAEALELSKVLY